jgi:hypothetical protein
MIECAGRYVAATPPAVQGQQSDRPRSALLPARESFRVVGSAGAGPAECVECPMRTAVDGTGARGQGSLSHKDVPPSVASLKPPCRQTSAGPIGLPQRLLGAICAWQTLKGDSVRPPSRTAK